MVKRKMMKKFFSKRNLKRILVLCLCLSMLGFAPSSSYAISYSDITSDSIKEKESKIAAAENEKQQLEKELSNMEQIKQKLEKEKKNLTNYVAELDKQLAELEERISELNTLIADKEAEIAEVELELKQAVLAEQTQYEAMKLRIQFMYEQGESNYLSMLMNAENFSDMLNKADYIEQLSAYDRQKLDEYVAVTRYVTLCKEELEAQKSVLDTAKADVETEQANITTLIDEKQKMINDYQSSIQTQEAAIQEYEDDLKMQLEIISQLESEVKAEKKEILLENGITITYDGGKLTWPCPSYTRISSPFGWRMHPTLKVNKFHNGVDMASAKGTDILAAYSGEVVAASYNSTMGNYVMMYHGNDFYTIYMHASKLCVSVGDIIVEGEKIAEVGSTGRSTGPHLHFGIRKNGEYVNPMDYL